MRREIDPDLVPVTVLELYGVKQGEIVAALMHLGTRLGLWAMLSAHAPCSSADLAEATELRERWLREWLYALTAAGFVQHEGGLFALTPEAELLLTNPENPAYMPEVFGPPMTHHEIDRTAEAFRTGLGMTWAEHGDHACHMQAAMSAARHEAFLVPVVLAAFDGAVECLDEGARIIDVGCGAGVAARLLATSFPRSTVIGIDPSARAVAEATAAAGEAQLANLSFMEGAFEDLPTLPTADLIVTLDVLHDLPYPDLAMAAVFRALSPRGWWLVADIKSQGDFEANRNIPLLPYMYGMSVFYCMSSALSEPGGAGLGTLGLDPARLEQMSRTAGFSRFTRHDINTDPTNWFYEIRP